jgi:uridine monophosphate synthetase
MTTFSALLAASARARDSLLCVGLDPRGGSPEALRADCLRLIAATAPFAAAFKPNYAFFEAFGAAGIAALRDVIAAVPEGIPVILDAKRGDIAETSEASARGLFDALGAHAVTVSPYMGGESLRPFWERPDRGIFALCKTSNPGAGEFQEIALAGGGALFEEVARRAPHWSPHGNVGLVVGSTYPEAIARARALAPEAWFLVPGIGAQGGDLERSVEAGLRADGLGMLINASRSIANAPDPAAEARRLRDAINAARVAARVKSVAETTLSVLARDLIETQCVRFGAFTLKSGAISPIYLDLRRLVTYPVVLQRVAQAYAQVLRGLRFDRLAGIPYAALPIATAISLEAGWPLIYPRREAKEYGTRATIEGEFKPGETVAVIDDLVTTGDSKIETIQKLEGAGLKARDIVVLIDRGQGAGAILAASGYALHSVVTLPALLDEWLRTGAISAAQRADVLAFLTQ